MRVTVKTMKPHFIVAAIFLLAACQSNSQTKPMNQSQTNTATPVDANTTLDTATFAGGCFWCTEAVFQQLDGVLNVKPGYTGGQIKNPSYKEVCTGRTGHAEGTQIVFDPSKISYAELLEVFFKTHDPTTLNRQGADVGTQYRSAIFYHNQEQRKLAEQVKTELNANRAYDAPIVTEISPAEVFYFAEDYHVNYFNRNKDQSYCQYVIQPKLDKFEKTFKDKLKKS